MIRFAIHSTAAALAGFLAFASASAQNSNLSDHDRYIHNQSEYNTRYFNNADSYPKADTTTLAAKVRTAPKYNYTPPSRNASADSPIFASSGPAVMNAEDLRLKREHDRFEQLSGELMRDNKENITELADDFYFGRGTLVNKELAYSLYRADSSQNARAAFLSARMVITGEGVKANEEIGIGLMRAAARMHSADAVAWLAAHGYKPVLDPSKIVADPALDAARDAVVWGGANASTIQLLRSKADIGDPRAQFYLAQAYENGAGITKDEVQAYKLYKDAADNDYPDALLRIGTAKWNGELGQERYDGVGTHYLLLAKDLGNAQAMYQFGDAFATGQHTLALDEKASTDFFIGASEKGHAPAEARLAEAYHTGFGIDKDDLKAAHWAQKALDDGEPAGGTLLAKLYASGSGVPQDPTKALELMKKAASRGNDEAKNALARGFDGRGTTGAAASSLLTPQQLAERAYAALPSIMDRLMEKFRRDHASIAPLTLEERKVLMAKYVKSKPTGQFDCRADSQSAYLLGRNLQEHSMTVGQHYYAFCAAMAKVPGALDEMLWANFLRYYESRDASLSTDSNRKDMRDESSAAYKGSSLAAYMLAALEQENKNPTLTRAYLAFASVNIPEAGTDIAAMEWAGSGGPVDEVDGTKRMLDSAKTDPNAMYLLGMAYADGLHGLTADPTRGMEMLTMAGAKGSTAALHARQQMRGK